MWELNNVENMKRKIFMIEATLPYKISTMFVAYEINIYRKQQKRLITPKNGPWKKVSNVETIILSSFGSI